MNFRYYSSFTYLHIKDADTKPQSTVDYREYNTLTLIGCNVNSSPRFF